MNPLVEPAIPAPTFPLVGIGASAGGLAAFEAFFSTMPADPGMAFILVQHLAPDHESLLTELIRRFTRMEVFEVEDGMEVRPNCTYIIPPNREMDLEGGRLRLHEPGLPRGQRLPIDFFFRSLAQESNGRAIGIVLSGTGSDGTLGLRAIKEEGGLVLAQTPASAEYDGMPRSAIATGLMDFELPPAEMPAQLMAHVAPAFGRSPSPALVRQTMHRVFTALRARTGHDFSLYKPSTIHRRLDRRMAANEVKSLEDYASLIEAAPPEVDALFQDLLIGVTSFFRDPEAFQFLEDRVIPDLFARKRPGSPIRVWVPGCSTGEEAYSIAILLQERLEGLKQSYPVQVFATDLDPQSIATARSGVYGPSIAGNLTPERLGRFFTLEPGGGYRIRKGIRDLLVFSEQDLIKDPPFSKLDLISCRNLLIYLGPELQGSLIPLFHYALNPGGMLFLGSSETIGDFSGLFTSLGPGSKVYLRREGAPVSKPSALGRRPSVLSPQDAPLPRAAERSFPPLKLPLRELTEQTILRQGTPPSALINAQGDILYFYGRTGRYLEPAPGEGGTTNILRMAREGLGWELTQALEQAKEAGATVRKHGLRVSTGDLAITLDLTVHPVQQPPAEARENPLFLVMLEEAPASAEEGSRPSTEAGDGEAGIQALRLELKAKEEYLRTTNEELKSSNEEMQSVNEELQSTNEELETSKEELQSVNEELTTVLLELQTKVADLSRANDDMNNLLAGTGVATLFVDRQLRLMRFTPTVTRMINLIQSDLGRPIGHIMHNLVGYATLVEDAQAVLATLAPKDTEVHLADGSCFRLHIQPYRTLENVTEGVVITFVDITEMKLAQAAMVKAGELQRLAAVVHDSHDAITVQDLEGRITAWNPGAVRMYGWTEAEALAMKAQDRIPEALRQEAVHKVRELSRDVILEPYFTRVLTRDGAELEVSITSTALVNEAGAMYAIATTERLRT